MNNLTNLPASPIMLVPYHAVKIIYFPVGKDKDEEERLDFLAATYLAAIEDDEEEDAVWEKYIFLS